MAVKATIAIDRCPTHGYYAISVNDESGGTRLTPGKCCGRWTTVREWPLDESLVESIETELRAALNAALAVGRE